MLRLCLRGMQRPEVLHSAAQARLLLCMLWMYMWEKGAEGRKSGADVARGGCEAG